MADIAGSYCRFAAKMEGTDMKEKADNPLTTPRAQISRREGLKLSATSIMASLLTVSAPAAAQSQSSPQKENTGD
jgi:hypothetical protein